MNAIVAEIKNVDLVKITVDQVGLDVYDAIVNTLGVEFRIAKDSNKTIDIAYIAGCLSTELSKKI